jgi:hypothetical protein
VEIDHEAPDWLVGLRQASVQLGTDTPAGTKTPAS